MIRQVKIEDVEIRESIYPRSQVDWRTAYSYAQSLRAGSQFPPITVSTPQNGKHVLIDGAHRLEALRQLKQKYVKADVKEYANEREMYLAAVQANAAHGRQYSMQERAQIILRLQDLQLAQADICKLVGIPADKIQTFVTGRLSYATSGMPVILKSPLQNLAGTTVSDDFQEMQQTINNSSQVHMLHQVATMLRSGVMDLSNPNVVKILEEIKTMLASIIP